MFVDEDVDVVLPPLPPPLDWSSRIPVSGMRSMMSPPAIDGMAADTSAMTVKTVTPTKRRLMDAGIPCPPLRKTSSRFTLASCGWLAGESSHERQFVFPAPAERQQGPCPLDDRVPVASKRSVNA